MTFSHWATLSHSRRSTPVRRFANPWMRRGSLFHPSSSVSANIFRRCCTVRASPPVSVRLVWAARLTLSFMFCKTRATSLISPCESFFMLSLPVSRKTTA